MIETAAEDPSPSEGVLIDRFVKGRPVVPRTPMGRRDRQDIWTSTVIAETMGLPWIRGPCELAVEFVVPAKRDPWELPWELALDNLLKWMLDALQATVLLSDPRAKGEVVSVRADRRTAGPSEETGARIVIRRTAKRGPESSSRRRG